MAEAREVQPPRPPADAPGPLSPPSPPEGRALAFRRVEASEWPATLVALEPPIEQLYVAGDAKAIPARAGRTVAIVGTRTPSAEASRFARTLAFELASRGIVVVSGGAHGIDAAAHEGALHAGAPTWVVAPSGHEHTYPKDHRGLFEAIVGAGGAVLSPFAPETPPHRGCFFRRNAVLAALSTALVVVQAGVPSGSLNAAAHARALGRPVWALSAPPWIEGYAGCASLIDRGARTFTTINAFLRAFAGAGGELSRPRRPSSTKQHPAGQAPRAPTAGGALPVPARRTQAELFAPLDDLDETERDVLSALGDTPKHRDAIVGETGRPSSAVAAALLTLVLRHVVVEGPDGSFRRIST